MAAPEPVGDMGGAPVLFESLTRGVAQARVYSL